MSTYPLALGWWDLLAWFGADPPKAPPPPKAPDDTSAADAAARARRDSLLRRGRRNAIYAGATGDVAAGAPAGTATKTRLGE